MRAAMSKPTTADSPLRPTGKRGRLMKRPRQPLRTIPLIVVFDIGNVLVRWDRRNLFRKVFSDEARLERFLADACAMDFVSHTDVVADFSEAVAERAMAFPEFAEELKLFDARWIETLGAAIEENVVLLKRLRAAGRPVHALSNFAAEKFELARARHPFLDGFDVCVVSGHVGVAKPDRRIFEILFERVGRRPGELLFIDDSIANIRASEAAGMPAIHYRPGVDLESEFLARGAL
jgi:2-haloacid dehalogenase